MSPKPIDRQRLRQVRPSGTEMARRAMSMTLDKRRALSIKHQKRTLKLTPASVGDATLEQLRLEGRPIGVISTELAGDETRLRPGDYNLHLVEVKGQWKVFAETNGRVVAEAVKVKVETGAVTKTEKKATLEMPAFDPDGWCFNIPIPICVIWLPFVGCVFGTIIYIRVCF